MISQGRESNCFGILGVSGMESLWSVLWSTRKSMNVLSVRRVTSSSLSSFLVSLSVRQKSHLFLPFLLPRILICLQSQSPLLSSTCCARDPLLSCFQALPRVSTYFLQEGSSLHLLHSAWPWSTALSSPFVHLPQILSSPCQSFSALAGTLPSFKRILWGNLLHSFVPFSSSGHLFISFGQILVLACPEQFLHQTGVSLSFRSYSSHQAVSI